MEKKEILRVFLEKGFQLDLPVLNFFSQNPNLIKTFLHFLNSQEKKPVVITNKHLDLFLSQSFEIKIIKPHFRKKKKLNIQDVLNYFIKRFEFFRSILSRRMELSNIISINRITPRSRKFSLIGLVRDVERERKKVVIEDTSGSLEVVVEDEKNLKYLTLDEVVGFSCMKEGEEVICKRIVWPDLPLKRNIGRSREEITCVFISEFRDKKSEIINKKLEKIGNCILILINSSDFSTSFRKIKIEQKSSFSWIYVQGVNILLVDESFIQKYIEEFEETPLNTLLYLLKKRHLNPTFDSSIYEEDPFILHMLPDIAVLLSSDQDEIMNYKGVTLISLPKFMVKPIGWGINLKTREYLKFNFS